MTTQPIKPIETVEEFNINNPFHAALFNINTRCGTGEPIAVIWDRSRKAGMVITQLQNGMAARRFSLNVNPQGKLELCFLKRQKFLDERNTPVA